MATCLAWAWPPWARLGPASGGPRELRVLAGGSGGLPSSTPGPGGGRPAGSARPPCPPPSPVFPARNRVQRHDPCSGPPCVCSAVHLTPSSRGNPSSQVNTGTVRQGRWPCAARSGSLSRPGLCMFGYVTLALTGGWLPVVFSGKRKANLPGGSTSLCRAVMLSVAASANIHGHILKPRSSRNKTQRIASRRGD